MTREHQASEPNQSKRIVICTTGGLPHSCRGASTVLFFHYILGILEAGWTVLHVAVRSGDAGDDSFRDYVSEISQFGAFEGLECRLPRFYTVNRWTRGVCEVALPEEIPLRIARFTPDLFLCFDITAAAVMKDSAATGSRVVWLGDLNFETVWYHQWYDAKEHPRRYFRLPLAWLECVQWRRFYRKALADAGRVIDASSSSVAELTRLGITSEYLPYPWPVHVRAAADIVTCSDKPAFLFFGTLQGLGSRSALRFLIKKLYPRLRRLWGEDGFTIYICGHRELPAWVAECLHNRPELVFKGFVDDLEDLGRRCHAVLAPINVPVGNRSRIVTAMAYGWTIVAHTNTARGNPELVSGKNCLLADSAGEFVEHMRLAVDNPEAMAKLGRAACRTYAASFAPSVATKKMLVCLEGARRLAGGPGSNSHRGVAQ